MKRISIAVLMLITSAAGAANADKTLVSWVTLTDKNVRAGSVLTVQVGGVFDGIVFAERAPGKWMNGSNTFARTGPNPGSFPVETADKKTQVQMAIVYKGGQVSIYRNAKPYASYKTGSVDLLGNKNNFVVFGLRHIGGNGAVAGAIDDARIYAKALTADELKSLAPNKASPIKPYAWWDFNGDKIVDRAKRYPHSRMSGGAKLAGGKLVLANGSLVVCAATEAAAKATNRRPHRAPPGPHVIVTPTIPDNPPKTWLTYHLAHTGPDRAIPGDPNCAIYYKGKYHLHYIFQNHGHSFAHVTSEDLVHWKWRPTVLTPPITGHGMFSGTAFMTKEGKAAIIYHGQGSRRNQIALALDDNLDKWTPTWPVEPKTADGKPAKMRHWDPDCWLRGDTYYALGGGGNPTIAKSKDLKKWDFVGELFHKDFPGDLGVRKAEDVSCANMFKIGDKWMLLCISHGLGARYYLGDFKGDHYLPTHHAMLNWARWDCFAPETLLTPDGRRVMWAWCTPWVNGMQKVGRKVNFDSLFKSELQPGIQCLPRELSLPKDGVLRIKPLRELEKLRHDEKKMSDIPVKSGTACVLNGISGDAMELEIVIAAPKAKEFGVNILCDKLGENGYVISHGAGAKTLKASYSEPPFELKKGEDLTLRIFIDKSMVEVFANDRQAVVTWHKYDPKNTCVSLFSKGGDITVKSVTAWRMKSIYPKPKPDPIHFVPKLPKKKTVGDVMPFFWKGEYHVFYLTNPMGNHDVNWEHCSSKDLVNWTEYPAALKPDPKTPNGPEGGCMFTGCIVEKEGVFHAWYTSWNPRNPKGREFLSHATSKDLVTWKKHPEHMIAPDGIHYANHRMRDFRDPQIFWNAEAKEYWMHVLANSAKPKRGEPRQRFGLLKSKDLVNWTQHDPVAMEGAGGDECPDYFKIGDTHYIHSCRRYYHSDKVTGPYKHPKLTHELDRPGINAAKRVWDGKRHVWFGGWSGGIMPLPREIYAGPGGLLYMKPVDEVVAVYGKTVLDLSGKPAPKDPVEVPRHYMLDASVKLTKAGSFELLLGGQYRVTLRPAAGTMSLVGHGFNRTRPCPVDISKPVKIQIFTEGKLIECFVNDQFATSCVSKAALAETLDIKADGATIEKLKVLVAEPAEPVEQTERKEGIPWDTNALFVAPKIHPTKAAPAPGMRAFFYEGADYKGKPTRVFAYYAAPKGEVPKGGWPAVVCAHGGGGTAYPEWIKQWTDRGYAAISMDLEGHLPDKTSHAGAGPARQNWFSDIALPDKEQWFYHAVADVIRANSLLRSFKEINAKKIGLVGISWGATIAATTCGVDDRFAFVVPIYGCGFLYESDNKGLTQWFDKKHMTREQFRQYRTKWDPAAYLHRAKMPMYWVNGSNDGTFPLDIFQKSALAVSGPTKMHLRFRWLHGHSPGWRRRDVYAFAKSIVKGGPALPTASYPTMDPKTRIVSTRTTGKIFRAALCYTIGAGKWQSRYWENAACEIKEAEVSSVLPEGATVYYFNVKDKDGNLVSSEFVELNKK